MLKNITLGQFFPGNSVLHRLDPRSKLIITLIYIVALFLCVNFYGYALIAACAVAALIAGRLKPRLIFNGLKPLVFVIVLTAFLNLFYSQSGTILFSWWRLTITDTGIFNALTMLARIILLICGTMLMTYTTSPLALTDALESLLKPLNKIRFPVHELAMMMSIALRFIPTLIEETDKIMTAQKARGADFETGSLFKRAKALLPLLVPLFVSAFRRADELAIAMDARCYNGGTGRTRMKQLRYTALDVKAFALTAVLLAAVIALRVFI
ncbi:MAG: energy-coupling factor transporter transmembrane protein EcfT [Oscillospiraceae bacterium]|jgi:energy-coupling factor transport system permease protein|nr:energy-coupling factor transporter transmembrane protein EcfT [Oscillospiraceae bacterium]